jgi:hypothetical protein
LALVAAAVVRIAVAMVVAVEAVVLEVKRMKPVKMGYHQELAAAVGPKMRGVEMAPVALSTSHF